MALGIGTDRFITVGRQATGNGVITTDIGTTVTTVTDGGNVKNVSRFETVPALPRGILPLFALHRATEK